MMKSKYLALFAMVFLLMGICPSSAYSQTTVLKEVKTALASCDIKQFFKVESAITDASPSDQDELARYFIERVKAASQCDSSEALLGMQRIAHRCGFAYGDLLKSAILASKQTDLLNGPHPRLNAIMSTVKSIYRSAPESRPDFFKAIAASNISDPEWVLAIFSAADARDNEALRLDPSIADKMRTLWKASLNLSDEQINGSRYSRLGLLNRGRVNLAKLTAVFFQDEPVDDEIGIINATEDASLRRKLLLNLANGKHTNEKAHALQKLKLERLSPTERILIYLSDDSESSKTALNALRKTYQRIEAHSCKVNGKAFKIELADPGKQYANDHFFPPEETTLWLNAPNLAQPLAGSWNSTQIVGLIKANRNPKSACAGLNSFSKGPVLILPFYDDDRPFGVRLIILLFDTEKMRTLKVIHAGEVSENQKLSEDQGSFFYTLRLQPSDSAEEKSVKVRGATADKVLDGILDTVYRLELKDRTPSVHVDIARTWSHFPYQKFLANEQEFAKAFQLDQEDPIQWIRVAMKQGKPYCIYPSRTRDLPATEDRWICRQ